LNYRFVPAVRLAREMVQAGQLGDIHHFRGTYMQEWLRDRAALGMPATPRADPASAVISAPRSS
jgi:predicted dehydrogenase